VIFIIHYLKLCPILIVVDMTVVYVFHVQDFRGAVERMNKSLGRPVVPDAILNQIIRYLPQLQQINEDLLSDLRRRLDNWYCQLTTTVLLYFVFD